jgi:hypothetical protein
LFLARDLFTLAEFCKEPDPETVRDARREDARRDCWNGPLDIAAAETFNRFFARRDGSSTAKPMKKWYADGKPLTVG